MQTTSTVWEATGRDGRVIAQVRTADQDAAYSALTAAIGADPLAAPEGWYFGEGRDLSRGCVCGYGVTNFGRHSRGCVLNMAMLAGYERGAGDRSRGGLV